MELQERAEAMKKNLKTALAYVPIIPPKARELIDDLAGLVCDLAAEVEALKQGGGNEKG